MSSVIQGILGSVNLCFFHCKLYNDFFFTTKKHNFNSILLYIVQYGNVNIYCSIFAVFYY